MAFKANAPYCLIENDAKAMEIVLEMLIVLVYWRLVLSVGVSALVAFWLSWMFPSFTSGYCIALVSLGTGLGIIWQTRPKGGAGLPVPVPPAPMSKPVAFLGFMFIGIVWGGLAAYSLGGSTIYGFIGLGCAVGLAGLWYRFVLHRPVPPNDLVFAGAALFSGYGILFFLSLSDASRSI
jgi:hypothetical protein